MKPDAEKLHKFLFRKEVSETAPQPAGIDTGPVDYNSGNAALRPSFSPRDNAVKIRTLEEMCKILGAKVVELEMSVRKFESRLPKARGGHF